MEWVKEITVIYVSGFTFLPFDSGVEMLVTRLRSDGMAYQLNSSLKTSLVEQRRRDAIRGELWEKFLKEEPQMAAMTEDEFKASCEDFRVSKKGAYL
jgi:hypothetical protein